MFVTRCDTSDAKSLACAAASAVVPALVLEPRRAPDHLARRLDLRRHVGDHERDALEGADRPAELLSLAGVDDRRVERGLAQADGHRADARCGHRRASCRKIFQPSPRSPSIWSAGTRQSSNSSSPVALACRPSFSSSRPTTKPGVPLLDDEGADLGRAVVALAGARGDDVRPCLAGVGDEALARR